METSCVLVGETVMKDGTGAGEQAEVSRQEVYEDYVNYYLQLCTEVRPCHDAQLLKKAALYLLQEPEATGTFTVFPFYHTVMEGTEALSTDYRKHLSAFIKATELLETLCINLFLQPWKKEIKTLKCFTGPFVYCLLPVLSSSTIQSVLGSIGYLPHTDTPQSSAVFFSEYKLSVDANPDRAMLLGFELLLARVECLHLLELLEKDQLGPQEWLEVLQRRAGPMKTEEHTEKKTIVQMEDEKKKKEEANTNEVPLSLDTRSAVNSQPKSRCCHLSSVDQSIMEMQMTYDDLAIRGRPLLQDKLHRANSSKSSSKFVHTASTNNNSDDSKVVQPPERGCIRSTKAAATTISSKINGSKVCEMIGNNSKSSGCNDGNSGGTTTPGSNISSSFKNSDGSRVDDELSGPHDTSLHITLRAGSDAEQSLKPGEPQAIAEHPAWTQQQAAPDLQTKRPTKPEHPSLTSMDEEQELRELAERMGQLHAQETKEEVKKKDDYKRGGENTNKERRKKGRMASIEGEAEEQNLRKPVMETSPAQSHAASRCTRSSHSDPTVMKEQKQPSLCYPSPVTVSTADCQSGGGSTSNQEGEVRETHTDRAATGRGEEEQLAQSYVIVEHHMK
ncbi:uncharacterized protein si:ch211-189a15.5 isoform X1 [Thunnus albacares]|uniref:uncharacterized protein si:ch211-189a15.5 isoform X1 n=1 Tax=Thunnus albacares TaxID=8236 RepID=UPI001CF6BEE8|nr:uncharacterized protein si:ch211-189a15.5 isoform X1 [Thunnus albacares]